MIDLNLTNDQLKCNVVSDIEDILKTNGSSLMNICLEMCPNDIFVQDG